MAIYDDRKVVPEISLERVSAPEATVSMVRGDLRLTPKPELQIFVN